MSFIASWMWSSVLGHFWIRCAICFSFSFSFSFLSDEVFVPLTTVQQAEVQLLSVNVGKSSSCMLTQNKNVASLARVQILHDYLELIFNWWCLACGVCPFLTKAVITVWAGQVTKYLWKLRFCYFSCKPHQGEHLETTGEVLFGKRKSRTEQWRPPSNVEASSCKPVCDKSEESGRAGRQATTLQTFLLHK